MKRLFKNRLFALSISILCLLLVGCDKEKKTYNDSEENIDSPTKDIARYVIMEDNNGEKYKIYYYGIESAMLTVDDNNYDFEQAILTDTFTLDEIFEEMKLYTTLNDGGTKIYEIEESNKYFTDSYRVVRCHTTDGNRDIYIGNSEMLKEEGFCEFKTTEDEIKLQEEIKKLSSVKKIIVSTANETKIKKTIADKDDIKNIIEILSHGTEMTLPVTSESNNLVLKMFNEDNKLISTIYLWTNGNKGFFGFELDKSYYISSEDNKTIKEIIE